MIRDQDNLTSMTIIGHEDLCNLGYLEELKEIRRRACVPPEDDGDAVLMFDAVDTDAERCLIL
ncbi:hypothetical protein ACP70R_018468 [Stipagrostis hirtigluma subsp. patula]